MDAEVALAAGDYRLALLPARGGAIARFGWRSEPLMRSVAGPSVLDTACYPLVPFSNRIANGRFVEDGREVRLPRNHPGEDHPHTLHGFGWLAAWDVTERSDARAVLRHAYEPGAWPWRYEARQELALTETGLRHAMTLTNLAASPMPAGLGFHPFFPCTAATQYLGLHRTEWRMSADGLPDGIREAAAAIDWWHGAPVGTRVVDTAYGEREGELSIIWPERRLRLAIAPSPELPYTIVYAPEGADFFCAEPVSHPTDAINQAGTPGLRWLRPGEQMTASIDYRAERC